MNYTLDLGKMKKGYIRGSRIIDANDWYFKAHFFQDPVQPGSLGVEAILQLLQAYVLLNKQYKQFKQPVFEVVALQQEIEWHYRGQVVPKDTLIYLDADITDEKVDAEDRYVISATGRLWVNDIKIYQAPKLSIRVIEK
ncbi:MAG: hypothetical protein O7D86_15570 [Proteobacteria bacterium]|nr:hypothetical protein [Pseudomonadota bacterium]